jgi:hypothetical protein
MSLLDSVLNTVLFAPQKIQQKDLIQAQTLQELQVNYDMSL